MHAESYRNEVPQGDREPRKPWQPPAVEVLLVDQTENILGANGIDGAFSIS
jgi:hypothetical protein